MSMKLINHEISILLVFILVLYISFYIILYSFFILTACELFYKRRSSLIVSLIVGA